VSISLISLILYILAFPIILRVVGPAGSALVIFPVGITARIWGLRGGIIAGVISTPINILLFNFFGDPITLRGGISGAFTVIILGAVIGWLSDLLEKIYLQSQELSAARDQALEANRLKSVMLSRVSHELRTPLGAVLGYAELLAEGTYGPVNEKQCEKLTDIVASAHELEAMVSDLLDMSRIESGRMQLFPKPFAVTALVDSVMTQTAVSAQEKNLQFTCVVLPDMPPTVVGDPVRITQILSNLVTNAIKYTDGGSVHVEIRPEPEQRWSMKVADTGIGIPTEAQPYIFEPFRQAHIDDSYARSGIGLGLSIVYELVTLMNGDITLNSVVGQGSSFTVTLPLAAALLEKTV
jgi:two-component system sensor histidine kinase BarA